ncbi:MAG: T9SS type A sorting domain-containing protein, partial [Bacteroidales bacterium]|nr:T9SS type A sorting domain-containing protein [Bacteroidales bacterium]
KYYGNPNVDDDMALLAMTDDGNYLVATVYGEWVVSPDTRTGRLYLVKIDSAGNKIWDKKIGPKMYHCMIRNIRETNDGNFIAAGFYYSDTISEFVINGWIYKFDKNGDSIWMRDYYYFNYTYDDNLFYDVFPASDNGYIAIGSARPDMGDNKMWIVKVDSMGCDTPGCITTVISEELAVNRAKGIRVWPNPCRDKAWVTHINHHFRGDERGVLVYNSHGVKVEEINIPENTETIQIDVTRYRKGLYYLRYFHSDKTIETVKFIRN